MSAFPPAASCCKDIFLQTLFFFLKVNFKHSYFHFAVGWGYKRFFLLLLVAYLFPHNKKTFFYILNSIVLKKDFNFFLENFVSVTECVSKNITSKIVKVVEMTNNILLSLDGGFC